MWREKDPISITADKLEEYIQKSLHEASNRVVTIDLYTLQTLLHHTYNRVIQNTNEYNWELEDKSVEVIKQNA